MAINATTAYMVRPGGSDVNGGGYDSAISGAIATTLTSGISTGATSIPVANRSNFPASGNFYIRIGTVGAETAGNGTAGSSEVALVTAGQGSGAGSFTVTRAQLGTSAVAQISGTVVDNNLSNADTAAFSGTVGTSTASTTFTDASGAFNATVVGNTLWLASGTGTTVSAYAVTGFTNSTTITLDRASGTYTLGVWKIGGAWAAIQTNVSTTYIVPGATIYLRGAGSNSPGSASPDYTHATGTLAAGSATAGFIYIRGSNGYPVCKGSTNTFCTLGTQNNISGVWFAGAATGSTAAMLGGANGIVQNCVFDQNGFDQLMLSNANSMMTISCEFFNSGSAPSATNAVFNHAGANGMQLFNNVHDITAGFSSSISSSQFIIGNIFANCGADVLTSSLAHGGTLVYIVGNTFDNGAGHGIIFTTTAGSIFGVNIQNNIFSNFSQASKFAINGSFNATALNDILKGIINPNTFYNNTANYNQITAGANDTQLSVSPYVNRSTENYRLQTSLLNGVGFPTATFPQNGSGKTSIRTYTTPGAVTPQPIGPEIL